MSTPVFVKKNNNKLCLWMLPDDYDVEREIKLMTGAERDALSFSWVVWNASATSGVINRKKKKSILLVIASLNTGLMCKGENAGPFLGETVYNIEAVKLIKMKHIIKAYTIFTLSSIIKRTRR